jgi:hypothetical protein
MLVVTGNPSDGDGCRLANSALATIEQANLEPELSLDASVIEYLDRAVGIALGLECTSARCPEENAVPAPRKAGDPVDEIFVSMHFRPRFSPDPSASDVEDDPYPSPFFFERDESRLFIAVLALRQREARALGNRVAVDGVNREAEFGTLLPQLRDPPSAGRGEYVDPAVDRSVVVACVKRRRRQNPDVASVDLPLRVVHVPQRRTAGGNRQKED